MLMHESMETSSGVQTTRITKLEVPFGGVKHCSTPTRDFFDGPAAAKRSARTSPNDTPTPVLTQLLRRQIVHSDVAGQLLLLH